MRKKIVGILFCMLVLATAVPAVTSIKNSAIHATTPSTPQANMAGSWTQMQKLLTSDGAAGDYFGYFSVSVDGNTALIGSYMDDDNGVNSGSAYVFTRMGTTWTEHQKLTASDGAAGDNFGWSVALDGDTALITADQYTNNGFGKVYVFTRTGTTWTQQDILHPVNGTALDRFGNKICVDGDTALIGAIFADDQGVDSGAAYVFTRTGTTWPLQQKLLALDGDTGSSFGHCVSLEGDTAFIGAGYDDDQGVDSGSAYVFTRTGTTWTQQTKLLASDGEAGDHFGIYVSLNGNSVLIGANRDDDNGNDSGSAYVYNRNGSTWTLQQKITPSDGTAGDMFGLYASLVGDTALIGAGWDDDHGTDSGSGYVFTRTGTTWAQQQKLLASDGAAGDQFGLCVAFDGDTVLIGASGDDDQGSNSGSAYVFTKVGLTFSIVGGLGISLKITNNGLLNATGVPWWIHVEGGILGLINQTLNGTINITAGETISVGKIMLFGFGPITITAKVTDEEQTATGFQIIVFSMVKK